MSKSGADAKPSQGPIEPDTIRELAEILSDTGLTEIEVEHGSLRVRVAKEPAPQFVHAGPAAAAPAAPVGAAQSAPPPETPAPQGSADPRAHPGAVSSPMVGTAYLSPEPGAEPFIKVGQSVRKGDTLLLIEAMKTFNPIKADQSGTVNELFVQDGTPVEFGQALLVLA